MTSLQTYGLTSTSYQQRSDGTESTWLEEWSYNSNEQTIRDNGEIQMKKLYLQNKEPIYR